MDLLGTLYRILPSVEGISEHGSWKRGGFVILVGEQRDKFAAFEFRKEEIFETLENTQQGTRLLVSFSISSREYNGKWFTSLSCYDLKQV